MKSPQEIEQHLTSLGRDWPAGGSIVERVMSQIERDGVRLEPPAGKRFRMSWLALAASLALLAALWWILSPAENSLYAQALAAIENARTIHQVTRAVPADGKPPQIIGSESWCERDTGFRVNYPDRIHLGNQKQSWTYRKQDKLLIRSESTNIDQAIDRQLDLKRTLDELKQFGFERYPQGDEQLDARSLKAYLVTYPVIVLDPAVKPDRRRAVVLLDDKSRIVRALGQAQVDDHWVTLALTDWQYDVPIDRGLFEPNFGDDVKIVDAGAAFAAFVDLDKALYRDDRQGVIFAIHRMQRFDDNGVLVVSSVRGTPETLAKYPSRQPNSLESGNWVYPLARNLSISPQGGGYFRIDLASTNYQGIDVCWWVVVPRDTDAPKYQVEPGKVKLPLGFTPDGEFGKENFTDEQGVTHHAMWDAVVELPDVESPPSLDEIADGVYADMTALVALPLRQLYLGIKPGTNTLNISSPDRTTADEYRAGTRRNVTLWYQKDIDFQLNGQFTEEMRRQAAAWAGSPAISVSYSPLVDDFTLAEIAKRTSIERLYLNGTRISDAGLRELAPLVNLRDLHLNDTPITDAGLKNLAGLTALRKLNVHGTQVTPAGIAELLKANPELKVVQ